ncbi:hypothetical protein BpHYR1_008521 [Brachionus plicatilis]|uniref:Uncharacterized protein n=1 Tax=Brachionus plicatilis TaxID=10195 RepID=A0A3M7T5A7_BRAPC|nr:hypothetical protein BpHYR1_008521 [Brachionus plicatilis]
MYFLVFGRKRLGTNLLKITFFKQHLLLIKNCLYNPEYLISNNVSTNNEGEKYDQIKFKLENSFEIEKLKMIVSTYQIKIIYNGESTVFE